MEHKISYSDDPSFAAAGGSLEPADFHKNGYRPLSDRSAELAPGSALLKVGAVWIVILLTLVVVALAAATGKQPDAGWGVGKPGATPHSLAGVAKPQAQTSWDEAIFMRRGCARVAFAGETPELVRDAVAGLCVGIPMGELMEIGRETDGLAADRRAIPKSYTKYRDLWFGLERI